MKRRIIKITASEKVAVNQLLDNISDEEFNKMSKAEKRIIAKAKLSPHPDIYLAGAADAIELTGASVTDAFIDFYNHVIQNWDFKNSEVTSASTQVAADIVKQLQSRRDGSKRSPDYTLFGLSNPKNGCIIFGELDGVIYKVTGQSKRDADTGTWTRTWTSCEEITKAELNSLRSRFSK